MNCKTQLICGSTMSQSTRKKHKNSNNTKHKQHTLPLGTLGDVRNGDGGSVGGEDGVGRQHLLHLLQHAVLHAQLLKTKGQRKGMRK